MVTTSAVMIVRNGAATVERAIASVRPHVDEICVLMAGESTDGTPEILARLVSTSGAPLVIERGEWHDDYGRARNEAAALASSDFILALDDDEELIGGENLRGLVSEGPDGYWVRHPDARGSAVSCWRIVLVRRKLAHWEPSCYESLNAALRGACVAVAEPRVLEIRHSPVRVPGRHFHAALLVDTLRRGWRLDLAVTMAYSLVGEQGDTEAAAAVLARVIPEAEASKDWQNLSAALGLKSMIEGREDERFAEAIRRLHASDPLARQRAKFDRAARVSGPVTLPPSVGAPARARIS